MSTRRPSPLHGRKPRQEDLAAFATPNPDAIDDVLPGPGDPPLRLLIVGINPSLWTAAVNAPFAHPGNRFWKSLDLAGITDGLVDTSRGLSRRDERMLAERGIGITNFVSRATTRADELTREELRAGGARLADRIPALRPKAVAVVGITAFRAAFATPGAKLGPQHTDAVPGWPKDVPLWALPNPSGLNAHETVQSLADKWHDVWAAGAR